MMIHLTVALSMLIALAVFLSCIRFWRGPSMADRLMAVEVLTVCAMVLFVLVSVRSKSTLLYDLVLLGCVVPFIGSIVVAKLWREEDSK
jgi:multisubunit Na+/H+ antiporter MnhF subunit